jgi:hypothetical protein
VSEYSGLATVRSQPPAESRPLRERTIGHGPLASPTSASEEAVSEVPRAGGRDGSPGGGRLRRSGGTVAA